MSALCSHGQPVVHAALKEKYKTACHEPLAGCVKCQGTGERWQQKLEFVKEGWRPCICLFVGHASLPLVLDVIRTVVEREMGKKEVQGDKRRDL